MTTEDKFKAMMAKGYDVNIECKSSERVYALTYEAQATKGDFYTRGHAIGSTLDELADNLIHSLTAIGGETFENN